METKICKYCDAQKPVDDFSVCVKKNGVIYRRLRCSNCYQNSKRQRKHQISDWFDEYKKTLKCAKCQTGDFRVLEFHHHQDNKEANVSDLVTHAAGRESILKEIEKCEVLCANCHRILHWDQRNEGRRPWLFISHKVRAEGIGFAIEQSFRKM